MRTRSTIFFRWINVIVNGWMVVMLLVMHVGHVKVVQVVIVQISHAREAADVRWRCSCRVVGWRGVRWAERFLIVLQLFGQIVLKRVEYGHNCRWAKSVCNQAEMGQVTLNAWLKNWRWFWITYLIKLPLVGVEARLVLKIFDYFNITRILKQTYIPKKSF